MEIMTENVIMAVKIAEIIFMKDIQENTVLEAFGSGTHRRKGGGFRLYILFREQSGAHCSP